MGTTRGSNRRRWDYPFKLQAGAPKSRYFFRDMARRRRFLVFACLVAPVALFLGGAAAVDRVEKTSTHFFETGKGIVETLGELARASRSRDLKSLGEFYSADFTGENLGLSSLELFDQRDGVRRLLVRSDQSPRDRSGAVADWKAYLDGFDSIDEVGVHLHRLRQWEDPNGIVAEVRFELIGTPRGAAQSGIDRVMFRMKFASRERAYRILEASLMEGDRLISDRPLFVDVANAAGVEFKNQYYPPFLTEPLRFGMIRYGPAGISAVDYDNDGFYDLFVPDGVRSRLFRNRGDGSFDDATETAGLGGLDGVSVGVFADYDNDGHKDLFVSRTFQPNQLFHNNGDGTFRDVTQKAGIGADSCTTVASWGDYNNDGFLDLYVGRYLDPRKDIPTTFYARNGEPNQLYRNNGDGTFTNVTAKAGVGETGLCLGTVFGDYDDDGFLDLYVVNDFGRNTLYHNRRDGAFEDVTVKSNTLAYGAGMSAAFADYDNDGKLDIYVGNIRSEHSWFAEEPTVYRYMINMWKQGVWKTDMPLYYEIFRQSGLGFVGVFQQMASGNTLLRNRGDGTFEDATWKASANPPGWFWGSSFADFDNDGWQDIYSVNGWVYNDKDTEIELQFLNNVVSRQKEFKTGLFFDPKHFGRMSWHGWERNRMLRNQGDGTFLEIGRPAGTDLLLNSRGIALADFWNRGRIDIAVAASDDRHALLKNQIENNRNWLAVELVGTQSNRDGVGARVQIRARGKQQMREVVLGDGYGSQNSLRQYFGLHDAGAVDEMIVRWPRSGIVQRFERVKANRIVEVTEGRSELVEKSYTGSAR